MITINNSYLEKLKKQYLETSFAALKPNFQTENVKFPELSNEATHAELKATLNTQGFAIAEIHPMYDDADDYLNPLLEKIFGQPPLNGFPNAFAYPEIKILDNNFPILDEVEPVYNHEGHTLISPRYIALYSLNKGFAKKNPGYFLLASFKPLYTQLIHRFGDLVELLFCKDAITLFNGYKIEKKPLLLELDSGEIGMSYSPYFYEMSCSKEVFSMFEYISAFVHNPNNQIRLQLNNYQMLLIDNCQILQGQTSFPKYDGHLVYKFSFGGINFEENPKINTFQSYDIVELISSKPDFSHVCKKKAILLSTLLTEDIAKSNQYELLAFPFKNEWTPDLTVSNKDFKNTGQKIFARSVPRVDKLTTNDIAKLIILPEGIKLTNQMRFAVRTVIHRYNLLNEMNRHFNSLIYITNTIPAGCTLMRAHDPKGYWLDMKKVGASATYFLPQQPESAICIDNLIRVKIQFTLRIELANEEDDFGFDCYFFSLLIDIENSTIWDARVNRPGELMFLLPESAKGDFDHPEMYTYMQKYINMI